MDSRENAEKAGGLGCMLGLVLVVFVGVFFNPKASNRIHSQNKPTPNNLEEKALKLKCF